MILTLAVLPALRTDAAVPINDWGDTLWFLVELKSLLENGWTWSVPQLSAPAGLEAVAFPVNTTIDWLLCWALSFVFHDPGSLLNHFWLLSIGITAWSCNYALRCFGVSVIASGALSLCYSLLPWVYTRNTAHINLVYMWVPLLALGALYLGMGAPPRLHRAYCRAALPACVLQGFSYIYFSVFAIFFLAIGAVLGATRQNWRSTLTAAVAAVSLLIGCVLANLAPSLYVWHRDGPPPNMAYKRASEAEIYGLKMRRMITPGVDAPLGILRKWAVADRDAAYANDGEGWSSRLGLIGTVGFLFLLALS
ncbi:MAG: hypothetical protein M3Z31_05480, partial [Pseudomonadota bacterium]|nr:hypothetical protein [Pseudomonadota bacterium]